jgi:mono/diheme cytochrome c family protein
MNSRKQILLWAIAAVLATASLVGALIRERRPESRRHAVYVIGTAERGAELFFGEKQCSTCHSVNGRGGRVAADLGTVHPAKPAMGWLATALWNHAPKMWQRMDRATPPHLDQEEMAHILAFLFQAGTGDRPGDSRSGELVFREKGCANCHAVRSGGAGQPPEISHIAASRDCVIWARAMWNHAQSMGEPITRKTGEWPEFIGDEMADLMAYAGGGATSGSSLVPAENALRGSAERGWRAFQAKCIGCHSVGGKGGRIGPELGPERDLPHSTARFAAVLWNHAPSMLKHAREASVTLPKLDGDEIKDIQTFLVSLQYFEPGGSAFLGERVFRERGCAQCHGTRAQGTSQGPRLRSGTDVFTTISLATALWKHGPEMWNRAERMGISWPTLESTDVGDLISFLNTPARP